MIRALRFPDGRRVDIRIGRGLLAEAGAVLAARGIRGGTVVLADRGVPRGLRETALASLRGAGIPARTLILPPGEAGKRLAVLERLARRCAGLGLRRDGAVAVLGGGVAGDLGGLLAALYMRGVPLLQLPTTLLAQADAAVGGKCAVDLPEGKNLLGTFHQPLAVLCDLDALATLPERRFREGFAEILKCALLAGPGALARLERDAEALVRRDPRALSRALGMALDVKCDLVSRDERESEGLRERLNLGHTLGHAAEAAGGYRGPTHGEAVAAGLAGAVAVSRALGLLRDPRLPGRLLALLRRLGLPAAFPDGLDRPRMLRAARTDKKAREEGLRMVLPVAAGRVVVRRVPLAALLRIL